MTRTESGETSVSTNRLALFFGVLLALVVGFVVVLRLVGISFLSVLAAYMFTPAIAGLAVCYREGIPLATVGLRVGRVRWLAIAVAIVFPIVALVTAVSVSLPGIAFDPTASPAPEIDLTRGALAHLPLFGIGLATALTAGTITALGEEFGWRGYLLWELAPLGFWKASFLVGAVWGLWHAPGLVAGWNYPSFPFLGIALMTAVCTAWGPLYAYLVIRAESVLAAAFFHGVFNTFALSIAFTETSGPVLEELVASEVGVAGLVVLGLVAIVIAISGAPHLTRNFAGESDPDAVVDRPAATGPREDPRS